MDGNKIGILSVLLIVAIFLIYMCTVKSIGPGTEGFDAIGYVENVPSEWFRKPAYDPSDWVVNVYPDNIQAECLPYSRISKYGPLEDINYDSSAYRFWRF